MEMKMTSDEYSASGEHFRAALFCNENNENFLIGRYNGVTIIYRASDKYVNVSKLCIDGKRDFRTFKRSDRWRKIIEYWNSQEEKSGAQKGASVPLYELKGKYDKSRGQYVHPKLIHLVADWISVEYAFKVADIMNLINERNQIENKTLEDTIIELTQQLEDAKIKIKNLETQVAIQQINIHESSVRVKENKRDLYIIEEASSYKLCADSSKVPPKVYKHYVFPASMNVKKEIGTKLNIDWPYYFTKEQLSNVEREIESLNPKKYTKKYEDLYFN